jgi:hypothetical protein
MVISPQAVAEIPFRLSKPFLINLRLAPGDVKTRPKSRAASQTSLLYRFLWFFQDMGISFLDYAPGPDVASKGYGSSVKPRNNPALI